MLLRFYLGYCSHRPFLLLSHEYLAETNVFENVCNVAQQQIGTCFILSV